MGETLEKYAIDKIHHLEAKIGRLEAELEEKKQELIDASIDSDRVEMLVDMIRTDAKLQITDRGEQWIHFSGVWSTEDHFEELKEYLGLKLPEV